MDYFSDITQYRYYSKFHKNLLQYHVNMRPKLKLANLRFKKKLFKSNTVKKMVQYRLPFQYYCWQISEENSNL